MEAPSYCQGVMKLQFKAMLNVGTSPSRRVLISANHPRSAYGAVRPIRIGFAQYLRS
jgi:hypothetical protein